MFKLNPRLFAIVSALTIIGCRGDDAGTGDGSSSTTGDATTTSDLPTTTTSTTGGLESSSSSTTDALTTTTGDLETTGNNSGNFLTTQTAGDTDTAGGEPNGGMCSTDADCASMNCVSLLAGMVQFCGACNEDSDCVEAGTGTACTLSVATQSAECTDGASGSTCMSDEACSGDQFCDNVLDTPILPNTCSECTKSSDCDMGKLCSPAIDLMVFSGNKTCVEPGSVANDALCPSGADGDMVCTSSHCTMANLLGFVPLNICGECASDGDCMMGQTCTPAEASMSGLTGSVCT